MDGDGGMGSGGGMGSSGGGAMRRWADTAEQVRATRKTSEKVRLVAGYLRSLDEADLPTAAVFLGGRPFPEREQRTSGLGWVAIASVVEAVAGADDGALRTAYDRSSDLGTAVGELFAEAGHAPSADEAPLTLVEVAAGYEDLAATRGSEAKREVMAGLLRRADPLTARYLVAILGGELRIGLREGHLEAAIAAAFERDLAAVQWAGMLSGDIGRTALLARRDALESARLTLFHPLKSMLASPVADEAEALARMRPPVWVEDKYDGIRAQLHKEGRQVRLFSRDLNDVTGQFPEVVRAAEGLPWDGILDGEVLGWQDGAALPFLELQSRLGRKAPSVAIQERVPVIYVAFDVLAMGEAGASPVEPLLRLPLRERRVRLEALGLDRTPGFGLAALVDAADADGAGAHLRRGPGPRQRGSHAQGPRLHLRARPARLRLAQAQEGAHDARLRGRRRGGRSRPPPRRALGLHVRRPGRPTGRRRGRPRHHRQGLLRAFPTPRSPR